MPIRNRFQLMDHLSRLTEEQLIRSFRASRAVHRTPRERRGRWMTWVRKLNLYRDEFTARGLTMPK